VFLKRTAFKGIRKVFPKSTFASSIIRLAVVFCILGCIVCIARTKANSPLFLLNTTAAETDVPSILDIYKPIPVENRVSGIESPSAREINNLETWKKSQLAISRVEQPDEWQTVRMRVTAYCPCEKCCGEYADGITACGHTIKPGDAFAAADRQYPFGTEMIVAGYNNNQPIKVLDRGGAIRENRLDVFFHTHEEALQWGVKYIDVKVHRK
jgi:3D (Asp-Asp-Asp) domain-containing protein